MMMEVKMRFGEQEIDFLESLKQCRVNCFTYESVDLVFSMLTLVKIRMNEFFLCYELRSLSDKTFSWFRFAVWTDKPNIYIEKHVCSTNFVPYLHSFEISVCWHCYTAKEKSSLCVYTSVINETHAPIAYYRPETNGWLLCLRITMMRGAFDLSINHRMEPISFTCFLLCKCFIFHFLFLSIRFGEVSNRGNIIII